MKNFFKVVKSISEWSGKLSAYILWPGVAVLVYEIVARHFFNAPTIWAHGITQRMFATYYIISGAYVSLTNSHVTMDLIYVRFSPRGKAIANLIGGALFFAFCGILLWQGIRFAGESLIRLEPDNTPFRAPIYPVKMMVPLGAFLILLQELAKFLRNFITVVTGREYEC
jgi:TRAP-type mannitol/chloroaromatic compound transport system permease small subunit